MLAISPVPQPFPNFGAAAGSLTKFFKDKAGWAPLGGAAPLTAPSGSSLFQAVGTGARQNFIAVSIAQCFYTSVSSCIVLLNFTSHVDS